MTLPVHHILTGGVGGMAFHFHPSTNTIARGSLWALCAGIPFLGWAIYLVNMNFGIRLETPVEQPVPFSHAHHVGQDGIDCRYCHTTVDRAAFAGMPSTYVCMTCHSRLWSDAPVLAPVRTSFVQGEPIRWRRVHDLPDFVYFDHSIHVRHGVGCVSCHGRVDQMPITRKDKPLTMAWCLDCHRHPEDALRPRERVYDLAWQVPPGQSARGAKLARDYHILGTYQLTNCSVCHH